MILNSMHKHVSDTKNREVYMQKIINYIEPVNRRVKNQMNTSFSCCQSTSLRELSIKDKQDQLDFGSRNVFDHSVMFGTTWYRYPYTLYFSMQGFAFASTESASCSRERLERCRTVLERAGMGLEHAGNGAGTIKERPRTGWKRIGATRIEK